MGLLKNGQWQDTWYDTSDGVFKREAAQLRNWIGVEGEGKDFPAESARYHLYVSLACPWAHRTLIFRKLKALEPHIGVSIVSPYMLKHGWTFNRSEGSTGDQLHAVDYLHQLYTRNKSDYTGRVTVPVLWDKTQDCIVSNESADIIRMFNSAFDEITGNDADYYPSALRAEIDDINADVYEHINNGVYRCGFATEQTAYEDAYAALFAALDRVEARLCRQRYLAGSQITEADWRLFTTLIRFDAVYHGHFKCNRQRLEDFPALSGYVRELYQWPGVSETVNFDHIKRHYYYSHTMINPTQIIPAGPDIDFDSTHDRGRIASQRD